MRPRPCLLTFAAIVLPMSLAAQEPNRSDDHPPAWEWGGFADGAVLVDAVDPENTVFRGRGTTWHFKTPQLNMAGAYVRKVRTKQSALGAELLVHVGKDSELFGFSATAPPLSGARWLRHVGLANVSYRAPVGSGLTVVAGVFPSLIGYDSLYAKDNLNYTRPWGADFTPYLMTGINASYPLTDKLTGTAYVITGYWHLAHANRVPTSGLQLAFRATPELTLRNTFLWGPHQTDTALAFWRLLSDTIVERRSGRLAIAAEYHVSTEQVAPPGDFRAWWMAAQLPIRWTIQQPWSASVRPEIAWDSHGRWTLAEQTVKAVTTTLEYRLSHKGANTILRGEYRWDNSRGPGGGFFTTGGTASEAPRLKPAQHLLMLAGILTFDARARW